MSAAPASAATERSSRAPFVIGGALVVVLLAIALLAGDSGSGNGPALSPTSTAGAGTRGLVVLLSELGADVRVGQSVPDASARVALLLHDGLDERSRQALGGWVEGGGTLVVTDPDSPLSATPSSSLIGGSFRGECDLPALADVRSLSLAVAPLLRVRSESQSCFGDGRAAFVVSTARGGGTVVSIGSPQVFVNDRLDEADNSVLAIRLLLPAAATPVAVLDPNPPGSGTTTLADLVADRVFQAIVQLGVAFVLYALWRSRRMGRPVTEAQPVAIEGSQFVRAVGGLQQRNRATDRAAIALRTDARRAIGDRFGLPVNADAAVLARLVAARSSLPEATVVWALSSAPVVDDDSLVQLSNVLDTIRQEVIDGPSR